MGVIHGRDLLSSKWPTAIIIDSVGAAHFFPIKNPIGDYFFAVVNNEIYAFNTRVQPYSWRQSMAKTFSFYIYFTDNYNPVTKDLKELEDILKRNDLPKLSMMLYKALKFFARKEKRKFEALEKQALIEELIKEKEKNPKRYADYEDLISFLKDLPIEQIVTPVRRSTDFLDDTFLAPDPAIFGAIKTSLKLLLSENKEVNHVEIKAKTGWFKIIAVVMIIGLAIGLVYFAYESGAFDNIGSSFGAQFGGGGTDEEFMKKYPSSAALKEAVDSGKERYDQLPPGAKKIYDAVSSPRLSP